MWVDRLCQTQQIDYCLCIWKFKIFTNQGFQMPSHRVSSLLHILAPLFYHLINFVSGNHGKTSPQPAEKFTHQTGITLSLVVVVILV